MDLVRKSLMLAALTALGLMMSVGAASATPMFNSAGYPATISGFAIGEEEVTFETQLSATYCREANTTGSLTTWSSSLNVAPAFGKCIGGPVEMNGCTFTFHTGTQISAGKFNGTLGWGGCGGITTYPSGCKMKFAPASGIGVTYEVAPPYSQIVNASGSGLKYTKECGADKGKVFTNGRFIAKWEFVSNNGALTILPDNGLYIAGAESEEVAEQPKVNAERYAAKLLGVQSGPAEEPFHEFETNATTVECERLEFTGQIPAASSSLTMNPALYEGCAGGGLQKATVKPNGCHYVFHVLNAGPPYTGSTDIVCAPGSEMETDIIVFKGTCHIDVPAQSGLKGLGLANVGSGSARAIKMTFNLTGIEYALSGNCGKPEGTYTNGAYRGVTTLSAAN